jgi:acyl-CoA thioesterase FadM
VKGLLIVLLICGSWWWFWGRADGAVKVIEAQLQAINQHDYATAYGYLSTKTKAAMTAEDFQERVQKNIIVTNRANTKFFSRSIDNDVATISGTIEALDNSKAEAFYTLVKEDNRWVIQSFSFK